MAQLSDKVRAKLEAPNLAFLGTVMEDGSPHVTPVWIGLENDYVAFNTAVGRVKERNMRRDPRVALSVADRENDYDKVDIRGRVVEMIEGEQADRQIDAFSKKYLGKDEYPWRNPEEHRVKVLVEPLVVAG